MMPFVGTSSRGRYDSVATACLTACEAESALLLIVNGVRGDGCSVCVDALDRETVRAQLTLLVKAMAQLSAEMEAQIEALKDG